MGKTNTTLHGEYIAMWEEHGIEATDQPKSKLKKIKKKQNGRAPKIKTLSDIEKWLGDCQRCGLCKERNKIVFGSGNPKTKILFVGEGPGANEDKTGLPFVGRAGELLNKIIEAMNLSREEIYIANIVKCRPPANRVPSPEEIEECLPFLKSQIEVIKPEMVVALGLTAASTLTGKELTMGELRGKFHSLVWNDSIPLMATYHPAYLLRNPAAKKVVWEDMKLVMKSMGKTKK
jgi:DNA polymerase